MGKCSNFVFSISFVDYKSTLTLGAVPLCFFSTAAGPESCRHALCRLQRVQRGRRMRWKQAQWITIRCNWSNWLVYAYFCMLLVTNSDSDNGRCDVYLHFDKCYFVSGIIFMRLGCICASVCGFWRAAGVLICARVCHRNGESNRNCFGYKSRVIPPCMYDIQVPSDDWGRFCMQLS